MKILPQIQKFNRDFEQYNKIVAGHILKFLECDATFELQKRIETKNGKD